MINKILFDMDGVLTLPRQKLSKQMKDILQELLNLGYKVGIVTGSGIEYITEQLDGFHPNDLQLYPCNGTQEWISMVKIDGETEQKVWTKSYGVEIDKKELEVLKQHILELILPQMRELKHLKLSNGEIVQNRLSMINFCPIGRSAGKEERQSFKELDTKTGFRTKYLQVLKDAFNPMGYDAVLGGETSFDIYPQGWDKTYALKHFEYNENQPIVFIGNSFHENGNDACMLTQPNVICLKVSCPEETIQLLDQFILNP